MAEWEEEAGLQESQKTRIANKGLILAMITTVTNSGPIISSQWLAQVSLKCPIQAVTMSMHHWGYRISCLQSIYWITGTYAC